MRHEVDSSVWNYDSSEGVVKVAMLRWDTVSLAWVKFTGEAVGPAANVNVVSSVPIAVTGIVEVTSNGTDTVALENTQLTRASEATLATRASQATLAAMEIVLGFLNSKTMLVDTENVEIVSSVLPTGAATETTLALIKAKTDNLDVALSTRAITGLTDAQLRASVVPVSVPLVDLVAASPTFATVGVASGVAVAAAAGRKGLILVNTSTSSQRISVGFDGAAAVLDSGVTLETGDVFVMEQYDFTTGAVAAIASAAAARLSVQEYS
jgi:hypothetical protein